MQPIIAEIATQCNIEISISEITRKCIPFDGMPLSPEQFETAIASIEGGASLKQAFVDAKCKPGEFFQFLTSNPDAEARYSTAQVGRTELLADEIITIADKEPDPQRARVRVEARKWIASKLNVRKYGDRIDVNVNQVTDIAGALADARARTKLLPQRDPPIDVECEVVKTIDTSPTDNVGLKPDTNGQDSGNANDSEPIDIFQ